MGHGRPRFVHAGQPHLPRRCAGRPRLGRHVPLHRGVVRHVLLQARQRHGRQRHPRFHEAARLRPDHRHRHRGRAHRHPALHRVEAQSLQASRAAEVVRRRNHLAGHRPGLQQLHHPAAGARGGDAGQQRRCDEAPPGQGRRGFCLQESHADGADRELPDSDQAGQYRRGQARDGRGGPGRHGGQGVCRRAVCRGGQDRHGAGVLARQGREVQPPRHSRIQARPRTVRGLRPGRSSEDRGGADRRERRLRRHLGRADRARGVRLLPAGQVAGRAGGHRAQAPAAAAGRYAERVLHR